MLEMDIKRKYRSVRQTVISGAQSHIRSVIEEFIAGVNFFGTTSQGSANTQDAELIKATVTALSDKQQLVCSYYESSLRDLMTQQSSDHLGRLNRGWIQIDRESTVIKAAEIAALERKIQKSCISELYTLNDFFKYYKGEVASDEEKCLPPRYFAIGFKDALSHSLVSSDIIECAFQELQTPFAISLRHQYAVVIDMLLPA